MIPEHERIASLRPSRIREVEAGAPAWTEVELVDVESGEGDALRSGLEQFGIRVHRTPVGQSRHLVAALAGPRTPYLLLLCHGDDGSILLPELAEEVERYQPYHGRITPAACGSSPASTAPR